MMGYWGWGRPMVGDVDHSRPCAWPDSLDDFPGWARDITLWRSAFRARVRTRGARPALRER